MFDWLINKFAPVAIAIIVLFFLARFFLWLIMFILVFFINLVRFRRTGGTLA